MEGVYKIKGKYANMFKLVTYKMVCDKGADLYFGLINVSNGWYDGFVSLYREKRGKKTEKRARRGVNTFYG